MTDRLPSGTMARPLLFVVGSARTSGPRVAPPSSPSRPFINLTVLVRLVVTRSLTPGLHTLDRDRPVSEFPTRPPW